MNQIKMNGYTRISKAKARKMFNEGRPIYLCPAKMCPGGPFGFGMMIDSKRWKEETEGDCFEKMVNNFTYYNCSHETGYYPAFYETMADRNSK